MYPSHHLPAITFQLSTVLKTDKDKYAEVAEASMEIHSLILRPQGMGDTEVLSPSLGFVVNRQGWKELQQVGIFLVLSYFLI